MEASPLTRQPQPEVFVPKIIELYSVLFKVRPQPPLSLPPRPGYFVAKLELLQGIRYMLYIRFFYFLLWHALMLIEGGVVGGRRRRQVRGLLEGVLPVATRSAGVEEDPERHPPGRPAAPRGADERAL